MTTAPANPSSTPGFWARAQLIAADIKLAHSVFALPFAMLGGLLAWRARRESLLALVIPMLLICVCMVAARTWAMVVNRLADRSIDAANPRTSRRAFAAGTLRARDGYTALALSAGLFFAACAGFGVLRNNWWPLLCAPAVLIWIAFYSYTKRFTALCHLFLGGALATSPLAAAVAIGGITAIGAHDPGPSAWLIAVMVLTWVAGFDVIYALQDIDFDRGAGLNSIPSKLGWRGAAWISRALHLVAITSLAAAWLVSPALGIGFGLGVAATAALLIAEHAVLARRGKAGIQPAFFTLNGVIAVVLGVGGGVDVLLG